MDSWTITELAERATTALADLDVNGRVQEVPGERLIRWYTTLGLLDPPVRQGRTARYTARHLLQLVAVKRRQAAGQTLAEIQAELTGAPDHTLTAITGPLPDITWPAAPVTTDPAPGSVHPPVRRFWTAPPDRSATPEPAAAAPPALPPVTTAQAIRLAPGVTLLLDGAGLGPEDLQALQTAARPLLAELAARSLIPSDPP